MLDTLRRTLAQHRTDRDQHATNQLRDAITQLADTYQTALDAPIGQPPTRPALLEDVIHDLRHLTDKAVI